MFGTYFNKKSLGDFGEVEPPVPIPNTEVKRFSAYDTALARVWENMSLPGVFLFNKAAINSYKTLRSHGFTHLHSSLASI